MLTLEFSGHSIGAYSFRLKQPGGSDPFVNLQGYQRKRQTPFAGVLLGGGNEVAYAYEMVASDEDS